MALAVAIFALIVMMLSLWGVVLPYRLASFVSAFMHHPAGLPGAVGLRIVLAVLLWFSAPMARTPGVFRVLAVLALIAAVVLPFVGTTRLLAMIDRFSNASKTAMRSWCLVGAVFGLFVLWSVYPALF